ncbi:hypothetical protein NDU88_002044 [Pleurodeles waltl]|uniref:Uncharacterized protein n=1 Tax=Pleurodeles waltl TaxID=8319 RepID=A0AAV7TM41_PLEWA|nr:hypothetical protein NDU88_002044 [Pleurodeles waltl]
MRLVGVPEKSEGNSMELFLEDRLFSEILRVKTLKMFKAEREQKVLDRPPTLGLPHRPIVALLLKYRDHILEEAKA